MDNSLTVTNCTEMCFKTYHREYNGSKVMETGEANRQSKDCRVWSGVEWSGVGWGKAGR